MPSGGYQQPHWMPAVKVGFDVRRHLDPLTTRLLTSPSMTASRITTPIRRARVKSHSRNSASVRSWSMNVAIPGSIHRQADTRMSQRWGARGSNPEPTD